MMGLISKTAMVGLSHSVKYYENLGYKIPRERNKWRKLTVPRGTKIEVKVEDLPKGSMAKIICDCDNCGKIMETSYSNYTKYNHDGKYYCQQCASKIFNSGENCNLWNPNLTDEEREIKRHYPEYNEFVKKVLARDNYTCQCCGKYGKSFEVHHLDGYDWCVDKRTDETNGITLCKACHKNFHSIYGFGDNTKEQFEEWIGYTIGELEKYDGELPIAKKVYCIEENKVYYSAREFIKEHNFNNIRTIYNICNHKGRTKSIKGFHLLWLHEYEQMNKKEFQKWLEEVTKTHERKVVCLNTGECFEKITKAQELYKDSCCISNCCKGKCKSAGVYKGEKLVWRYYEDYINMTKDEIKELIKTANKTGVNNSKKVICITTKKIFNSANEGGRYYNLKNPSSVTYVCKGKKNFYGKLDNGTKLQWKYIEDLTEEECFKYDIENKLKELNKEEI